MPDTLTTESKRWLVPVLSRLTEQPEIISRNGREFHRTAIALSDGEILRYLQQPSLDGKGIATHKFIPRKGTVPIGNIPRVPVTSTRGQTAVRAGSGLVVLVEGFAQGAAMVVQATREVARLRELQQLESEAADRAEEDLGIAAAALAAAQTAAQAVRQRIGTEKKLRRKVANPPRTKIRGYSRV